MRINTVFNKFTERFNEFKCHPVTQKAPFRALFRYVLFNTIGRVIKERTFRWIFPLKFYARIGDAGMSGNVYFGLTEINESLFTLLFLREGDLFIDIGANLGHYTLLASGVANAETIAMEPIPSTFKQLQRQIKLNQLNDKVETLNIGLADGEKELLFTSTQGTMNKVVNGEYEENAVVSIRVKKLDDVCKDLDPVLIKLDVEGYEKFVLEGAKNTIQKDSLKAVIVELNGSGEAFNVSDKEVYEIMLMNKYKPYKFEPVGRALVQLNSYNRDQYNTIFIKDIDFCRNRINSATPINVMKVKF